MRPKGCVAFWNDRGREKVRKMNIQKWLSENTSSLAGKTVAVTGATGGLGRELCRYLAGLGASLILLDRSSERSEAYRAKLLQEFAGASVRCVRVDLEDMAAVRKAVETLRAEPLDVFIHNAGAYSIPRHKCSTGFDNVFQINFVSPYYIVRELLPMLRERGGKVVAVGSIAHNYSKSDAKDLDFSRRKRASRVYGNSKRYLMFSLLELFRNEERASVSITHPGISFTNITAHYPRAIFAVIKHPMKVIFMKPKKACLSVLRGVFDSCGPNEWIGPAYFDVWGFPKKKTLRTCTREEREAIVERAEKIYREIAVKRE